MLWWLQQRRFGHKLWRLERREHLVAGTAHSYPSGKFGRFFTDAFDALDEIVPVLKRFLRSSRIGDNTGADALDA